MTPEELELFPDIRDFTTLCYVILRRGSIASDLDMRFAIWSPDLALHDVSFFKHSF